MIGQVDCKQKFKNISIPELMLEKLSISKKIGNIFTLDFVQSFLHGLFLLPFIWFWDGEGTCGTYEHK
jgi:hypothetical protein